MGATSEKQYVEDVFSTYLYTGNDSTQTINNGINLADKGGLCWVKNIGTDSVDPWGNNNLLQDSERGYANTLLTNSTNAQSIASSALTGFTSSGFSTGYSTSKLGYNYISWTFRKAPKFFDIVTYTGDGTTAKYINHNLGIAPGMVIIKRTDATGSWIVMHRSYGWFGSIVGYDLLLNSTSNTGSWYNYPSGTVPTSTTFRVGTSTNNPTDNTNLSGATYVAYLFAHDTSVDGIIQCGEYTATGTEQNIDIGWEPQFLLYKRVASGTSEGWKIIDSSRGWSQNSQSILLANAGTAGTSSTTDLKLTSTGFKEPGTAATTRYIYMAIRRPMKTPTDATKVFSTQSIAAFPTGNSILVDGLRQVDLALWRNNQATDSMAVATKLIDTSYLTTNSTSAETATSNVKVAGVSSSLGKAVTLLPSLTGYNYFSGIGYFLQRAPGFFDVVCYKGDSNGGWTRWLNHNLGVAPNFVIVKSRSHTQDWMAWSFGSTIYPLYLNKSDASPYTLSDVSGYVTNTQINVGSLGPSYAHETNNLGVTYVAYLFVSCPGVSKTGSYTGNGSSQTIDCGFAGGARFVLIKRTDSAGDWYVWDTTRGIVDTNDPHLSLITTAAEVTTDDSIDPNSSGFIVNQDTATNINVSSATYIYLAIA